MRRADRLFHIIQILRRTSRPATAAALAAELEVSKRTVYRDIADLVGQRVPIDGAAGVGYVLGADYDLPPLTLTPDEIEAAVLGAEWVAGRSDKALANAARDLIAKLAAVVPAPMRALAATPSVGVKPPAAPRVEPPDASRLRAAIRDGVKLRLRYRSLAGEISERTVQPVILGYAEASEMLVAWCELRGDFRHFRVDRILEAEPLAEPIGTSRAQLRRRWRLWREAQMGSPRLD